MSHARGSWAHKKLEPTGVAYGWLQGALQALAVADPLDMDEALAAVVAGWMGEAERALPDCDNSRQDMAGMLLGAFSGLGSKRCTQRVLEAARRLGFLDGLFLGRHEDN